MPFPVTVSSPSSVIDVTEVLRNMSSESQMTLRGTTCPTSPPSSPSSPFGRTSDTVSTSKRTVHCHVFESTEKKKIHLFNKGFTYSVRCWCQCGVTVDGPANNLF